MTFREIALLIASMSEYDKDCEALVKVSGFNLHPQQSGLFVCVTGIHPSTERNELFFMSEYDTEQYSS